MGRLQRMITTVNTHTGGQPTSTVIAGLPRIKGSNMSEKMLYTKEHLDWIRTFLTSEPRGSKLTSVAILTEPTMDEADVGVFFFESHCYMPLCGHDTIGVATMLVETGMIEVTEPVTTIKLETPNGLIQVRVAVEQGKARSVTFQNAPCFAFGLDLPVELDHQRLLVDVGYGGNFYAFVKAADLGLRVEPDNYHQLIAAANRLLQAVNEQHKIVHPQLDYMDKVTHVSIVEPVTEADGRLVSKNSVIYPPGEIDRSPCGTGTSARTAVLHTRGLLPVGKAFEHRSIIDSVFTSLILSTQDYCGYQAIIPEITGSACITGRHSWTLDAEDDKGYGFVLGR